jgi:hypothetical protein
MSAGHAAGLGDVANDLAYPGPISAVSDLVVPTGDASSDPLERGRHAARLLLDRDDQIDPIEEFDPLFATAALAEIEALQESKLRGLSRRIIRGANRSARNWRADPAHGLVEVIQNAEDQGASAVRLAVRKAGGRHELLIVHDGARVRLDHVLGMVFPFVTTKLDDPETIGRYGIGLKTLRRLGSDLEVHCPPFHFGIEDEGLRQVAPAGGIPGFCEFGATPDTLLRLTLDSKYPPKFFSDWLAEWDASHLVFMRHLRSVSLVRLPSGRPIVEHGVKRTSVAKVELSISGSRVAGERANFRDVNGGRRWTRYRVERPTKRGIERADKTTGDSTPISVALPARPARGRMYAGLPLEEPCTLPFCVDAHFDPDSARTHLQENEWNTWLLGELEGVILGVAFHRFGERPSGGWGAVPTTSEGAGAEGGWLSELVATLLERVNEELRTRLRFRGDDKRVSAGDLIFETDRLDQTPPLLDDHDLESLLPAGTALRREWRDASGRWRVVAPELGAREVDVRQALDLFRRSSDALGHRPAKWFVDLAAAGIAERHDGVLNHLDWVITADGDRLSPAWVEQHEIFLVRRKDDASLAARLGLVKRVAAAFLSSTDNARRVRRWLDGRELFASPGSSRDALGALGGERRAEPLDLSADTDLLLALRDALDDVALVGKERTDLARGVGKNILVAGRRFLDNGREEKLPVRPSQAYLPRSIDTTPDGFHAAARKTPSLLWVDPKYIDTVRGSEDRATRRTSGARAFFGDLGAAVTPRLERRKETIQRHSSFAAPIPYPRCVEHAAALRALSVHNPHLQNDWTSPDLLVVIDSISRDRLPDRRERGQALLSTLGRPRNWTEHYEGRVWATVVGYLGSERYWPEGRIRATWAAEAASRLWLTNQRGKKKAPRDLVVQTEAYEAVYGRVPELFAWGLGEDDAQSPALEALAIEGRPSAASIIERLEQIRADELDGHEIELAQVARCYAALARAIERPREGDAPMDRDELKRRFRGGGQRGGLVRSSRGWLPPGQVFRGQPIFGERRAFIQTAGASGLWDALDVQEPSVGDAVKVLGEIAQAPLDQRDQGTLIGILSYIERHLAPAGARPTSLASLPLWDGKKWTTSRKLHAVLDPSLHLELGRRKVPVWHAPSDPGRLPRLIKALGLPVIDETAVEGQPPSASAVAAAAASGLQDDFAVAVDHLSDLLAVDDYELHEALSIGWQALAAARVALDPDLEARVTLGDAKVIAVAADAQLFREPLHFCVRSPESAGDKDAGGHAIASLFDTPNRKYVALAWADAWTRAWAGEEPKRLELASPDRSSDPLSEWSAAGAGARKSKGKRGGRSAERTSVTGARSAPSKAGQEPEPRRLARLEDIEIDEIELVGGDGAEPGRGRKSPPTKLRPPGDGNGRGAGTGAGGGSNGTGRARIGYSVEELQALGLEVLDKYLREMFSVELVDQHHIKRVGSDAVDELAGLWIEMKAHGRDIPDTETLTAHEAERAWKEGPNYLLAVVGGLEQGERARVRIFSDPLKRLDYYPDRGIRLAGVRKKKTVKAIPTPRTASRKS